MTHSSPYDPFAAGPHRVLSRTLEIKDAARGRIGTPSPGEAAWISGAMRPFAELCPEASAHACARGLALAHFDATLRRDEGARQWWSRGLVAAFAAVGIDSYAR